MFTPQAHGGHPRYAHELMTALAAQPHPGFRFELISTRNLHAEFKSDQYAVHAVLPPLQERSDFRSKLGWAMNRLAYYPRRELAFLKWLKGRPDVVAVHLQEWKPWLAAWLIRRIKKMGKSVFYTVHNIVPHHYPRCVPKSLMNAWIRKACRECDGLYVLSDQLVEKLSTFLGESHPPIYVTPHGVWTVADIKLPSLKDRLARKKLLFFGSIRKNKGLDLLLATMELLPDFSLTIAGSPDREDYFEQEILPAIQRLRAAGRQIELHNRFISEQEVGSFFSTHSAIVLPYTEGFVAQSGVAFMALAYDLPMVSSEVGGLQELMSRFAIGTTFKDATPDGLATAVRGLFANENVDRLNNNIRAAKQHYSWQLAARETIAGYQARHEGRKEADAYAIQTHPAH
jgi:glycosyltransferase involved in cell wall biosynthesis